MAAEATPVEGPYNIHDRTIAVGTAGTNTPIQGTLMQIADPRTIAASSGDGVAFGGILANDKKGGEGTEIGCWTTGTFVMTAVVTIGAEGAIATGHQVVMSGVNLIRKAVAADLLTGAVVGIAMEDIAAGTTGEVTIGGV